MEEKKMFSLSPSPSQSARDNRKNNTGFPAGVLEGAVSFGGFTGHSNVSLTEYRARVVTSKYWRSGNASINQMMDCSATTKDPLYNPLLRQRGFDSDAVEQ